MTKNILVVEDEPLIRILITNELKKLDCITIFEADNVSEAKRLIEKNEIEYAFLDIKLEESLENRNGYDLARSMPRNSKIGFITSYTLDNKELESLQDKVYSVLYKPFELEQLTDFFSKVIG